MIDYRKLKGMTVAITGASSGIGKETAILLSSLGANLVLGARNEQQLQELSSQLDAETLALALDVTSEESVRSFSERAIERFRKIDALVTCAGTGVFQDVMNLSTEDFDRMIHVNLRGTFLCCKYFGQHMLQHKEGKIITIVSIAGTTALPGCGGYSASKFGVLGLTKALQAELRGKGVTATAILPGAVATPFWDRIAHKPDVSNMIPTPTLAKHISYILCQPEGAVIDEVTILPPLGIL